AGRAVLARLAACEVPAAVGTPSDQARGNSLQGVVEQLCPVRLVGPDQHARRAERHATATVDTSGHQGLESESTYVRIRLVEAQRARRACPDADATSGALGCDQGSRRRGEFVHGTR